MKRLYKYDIAVSDVCEVAMPVGAEILSLQSQRDAICLWAIVDPDAPKQVCRFRVYGTGHPLPDEPGVFIGTVQLHGGSLVFHVFEEAP